MTKREFLLRAIALASRTNAFLAFPTPVAVSTFVVNAAGDLDDGTCGANHRPCRSPARLPTAIPLKVRIESNFRIPLASARADALGYGEFDWC